MRAPLSCLLLLLSVLCSRADISEYLSSSESGLDVGANGRDRDRNGPSTEENKKRAFRTGELADANAPAATNSSTGAKAEATCHRNAECAPPTECVPSPANAAHFSCQLPTESKAGCDRPLMKRAEETMLRLINATEDRGQRGAIHMILSQLKKMDKSK